jgi:glycosyltransferase involved in cell wall biosynthesis
LIPESCPRAPETPDPAPDAGRERLPGAARGRLKVLLFANTDWYLFNFRRSLAEALLAEGHEVLLVSPPGAYGRRLQGLGFSWVAAPMQRRSLNPLRELALVLWLKKLMRAEQVDLVHGFTIKCAIYGSLASRLAGCRARVNAVAGMGYVFTSDDRRARLLRPLVRSMMRLSMNGGNSRLILQNADDVELISRAGIFDPERIRLIPGSGVDCRRFGRVSRPAAGGEFRVLLAARILRDKGVEEYAAASRMLRAEGRAIRFLLAGEPDPGNPASVPRETVSEWVAEGSVEWLGHVQDMPSLLASVHAVVLPSYREGLPRSLIEAGACGLPLVTTDTPGCREVVEHERDGLLVRVRDPRGLADAIARLQDDGGLAACLGAAARQKALTHFDEKIVIRRTLEVYRELVPDLIPARSQSQETG